MTCWPLSGGSIRGGERTSIEISFGIAAGENQVQADDAEKREKTEIGKVSSSTCLSGIASDGS